VLDLPGALWIRRGPLPVLRERAAMILQSMRVVEGPRPHIPLAICTRCGFAHELRGKLDETLFRLEHSTCSAQTASNDPNDWEMD
jgi:hypothetical protein